MGKQPLSVTHTAAFIERWRALLVDIYRYREFNGAMLVPGLSGRVAVYLPLLNYTDKTPADLPQLSHTWAPFRHQVRILNPYHGEFLDSDTVTMRLDIDGLSAHDTFTTRITSKCRNQIRKSERSELVVKHGIAPNLINDFYALFARTMHRYGTPVYPKSLFIKLPAFLHVKYFVAYYHSIPVAGLCVVFDKHIAWVPWAGSDPEYWQLCPNHLLYWNAITDATERKLQIFDFGRSSYNGPTFQFKKDWGTRPVKIEIASSHPTNIYARYSTASAIWRRLPRVAANSIGPTLCKYLPDL